MMTTPNPHHSRLKYRPDIDGLRAVAILSVVAFHTFPRWIKGGFIGVDIFFVISGFLISTIIFETLERGTFSLLEFYARRIKRIFPALLFVLIASFSFGWFALLANEYAQLAKHVAAGSRFISNFALWNEAGYFDNSIETKPLMHLWSLGIEEQFYIVWPLFLWFSWKRYFNFLTITLLLTIGSFYLNVKGINKDAVATFYSPQTRFWELLCGSLLAWGTLYKKGALVMIHTKFDAWLASAMHHEKSAANSEVLSNIFSSLGLLLLAYGFWRINNGLSFPGQWAVVPVLGSALIIFAGPISWLNRTILSNKVMIWFGLISFPLYLWHWPLLSFARIIEGDVQSHHLRIAVLVLSVVLAWLTYRLIECPIRLGKHGKTTVSALVALMTIVGYVGHSVHQREGLPSRPALRGIPSIGGSLEDDPHLHSECMKMYGLSDKIRYCKVSSQNKPNIAIIGDSHAAALFQAISDELKVDNLGVLNIGGRLFLDVATYPNGNQDEIEIYKGGIKATEFAAKEKSIDTVVMVSRGPEYLKGDWNFYLISDPTIMDRKKVWAIAMRKTLKKFVGYKKNIIFVLDNPEIDFDPRICLRRPLRLTKKENACVITRRQFDLRNKEYRDLVISILKDYPTVKVFDAAAYFCNDNVCRAKIDDKVLYSDSNHLSYDGAKLISKGLVNMIRGNS